MLKYELIDLIELIRCNGDKELMGAFIDEFHQKILNICKGYENKNIKKLKLFFMEVANKNENFV